jgi:hypothetical protein
MTDDPFIAFYRKYLGSNKRPSTSEARFFIENIRLFALHCVRYRDWSLEQADELIDEAHALIQEHS